MDIERETTTIVTIDLDHHYDEIKEYYDFYTYDEVEDKVAEAKEELEERIEELEKQVFVLKGNL